METDNDLARQPLYNIRSVSERTGIAPETLRAWERRYGYPQPHRNSQGYRLYSEDEIAALKWLRHQTETGMAISQATQLLKELKASGRDPVRHRGRPEYVAEMDEQTPEELRETLIHALVSVDEERASELIASAFAYYDVEDVLMEVIAPAMVAIGDRWHSGEIPIAVEHFASQLCRTHLFQELDRHHSEQARGEIVAACAPGEWHEIGILMVAILLRARGWKVTYLGGNLGLERFSEMLRQLKPRLVLFSANTADTAESLIDMLDVLDELPDEKPLVGLGGQAFIEDPTLTNRIPGTFFGPRADEAVRQIEHLLESSGRKSES